LSLPYKLSEISDKITEITKARNEFSLNKFTEITKARNEFSLNKFTGIPRIYNFECGCQSAEHSVTNNRITCLKHPQSRMINAFFICQHCGEKFISIPQGFAFYCSKCATTKRRFSTKLSYLKKRKDYLLRVLDFSKYQPICEVKIREKKKKEPRVTHCDCRWYLSKCLLDVCKNAKVEDVNCADCNKYERQELDITEYIECRGGYEENEINF